MSAFDPMAVALDWFDAYRSTELATILELHANTATLECGCGGQKIIVGIRALEEYWRDRFVRTPALELYDLQSSTGGVDLSYKTVNGVVRTILDFNKAGKIAYCQCGPWAIQ